MAKKTEFQIKIRDFEEEIIRMVVDERNFEFTDIELRAVNDLIKGLEKILELSQAKQEMLRMQEISKELSKGS